MKRIYLDYAASTPVDPIVFRKMRPYFGEQFGNPGSLHSFGQAGIGAVDVSRETIAKTIGARFREIVFVSSATEANTMALRGAVKAVQGTGASVKNPRIIISAIEHESILETARELAQNGVDVVYIPVDPHGIVDLKKIKGSLTEDTMLVSVMYANNEIGSIQPIQKIGAIIQDFRKNNIKKSHSGPSAHTVAPIPYFHTDAAQAFQFLDCDVRGLGVDLMTLSAHKIYGPKGAGALYVREGVPIAALTTGGGQEFGLRSGTENVPAIVGFAAAVELRSHLLIQANEKMANLKDRFWKGIKKIYPKAKLNGPYLTARALHLPNVLNVHFPNYDAQDLLTRFDLNGLAASSGSACRSRAMESSYVIQALGHSKERAGSSIRFSLGRPTKKEEVDEALKIMKKILK